MKIPVRLRAELLLTTHTTQPGRAPGAKADDLSLIPGTHMVEGQNCIYHKVSSDLLVCYVTYIHRYIHMYTHNPWVFTHMALYICMHTPTHIHKCMNTHMQLSYIHNHRHTHT